MDKDTLIANQQIEVEELKKEIGTYKTAIVNIQVMLIGIGGPLNDNYYQYTDKQLKIFRQIERETEVVKWDEF